MKIYISDHLGSHKTTIQMEKWFASKGHEVSWDMYYEPKKAEWCDIMIFEWLEGMVELALKDGWGKKKPIYCRAMDIEIWANNANGADISDLTGLAYTSKAMFEVLKESFDFSKFPKVKLAHIPLSIDMNEWTFKDRAMGHPMRKVAVIGHMWDAKGANLIPHFVKYLIERSKSSNWEFHIQGNWRHDVWKWYLYYFKHIISEMGLEKNIIINEDKVPSVNEWLEDKNFLVTFSMKDAFSLIVGEAMAKGIKAIPHNFIGAKDIWGEYVWTTFDDLYNKMVNDVYDSEKYKNFVRDNYSNEIIMKRWEQFIGI